MRKLTTTGLCWIWIAALVLIIDMVSKQWMIQHIALFEPRAILPFFNFTLAFNTGAAFSFLDSANGWQNWFLGGLAAVMSVSIVYWLYQLPRKAIWMSVALNFILAGALGNGLDRIQYGYVIDFLDFHLGNWHFAIFNLADSAICVGAFMLICNWMKKGE